MGEWKGSRQRGQGLHQKDDGWPTRSPRHGRPPPSPRHSGHSVPRWERQFCSQIRWNDFCEKKKMIHIFPKVLDWDDSAGKKAFDNAKARYWAEINGLSCDIPLPDPNMFIDMVDQDAFLDPKLVEDLYRQPPPPIPEVLDYNSIKIIPTGWDVESPSPSDFLPKFISAGPTLCENVDSSVPIQPTRWDDSQNQINSNNTSYELIKIIPTCWADNLNPVDSNNTSCESIKIIPTELDYVQNQIDSTNIDYEMVNIIPTGWGDDQNPNHSNNTSYESIQIVPTGWGDDQNPIDSNNNGYESIKIEPTGWGDEVESGDNGNSWMHGLTCSVGSSRRKQGGRGCFGSKRTDMRCQGQRYRMNGNWNEFIWRKKYGSEKHPLDFGFSYAPVSH